MNRKSFMIFWILLSIITISAVANTSHENSLHAAAHMERLENEVQRSLDAREGLRDMFNRYQAYTNNRLDASKGSKSFKDKTGNCRLSWYERSMRNQLKAATWAETFTRQLHKDLSDKSHGLRSTMTTATWCLDLQKAQRNKPTDEKSKDWQELVKKCLSQANKAHKQAFAALSSKQIKFLTDHLYKRTTSDVIKSGAYLPQKEQARKVCDLLETLDRSALHNAGQALLPLAEPAFWESLRRDKTKSSAEYKFKGVKGNIVAVLKTDAGHILIGGRGANEYQLEEMRDIAVVIDRGGNDKYFEGTVGFDRPILVIIDMDGNDVYEGKAPGIQGAAICGVSMLLDLAGDDSYYGSDVVQGACLAGVGILLDVQGNDNYKGLRRAQGSAMGGTAILLDRQGNDRYHAALYAQGFGGPLGFGVLDDIAGDDHYYAGGLFKDSYDDTPGYAAWSQGVGAGPRGVANGGIGVLLDGSGDDIYECDYFSHGGGYWFALGFARDFGGNDRRVGATKLDYNGKKRDEDIFLRWGIGFGCHYANGFVFDDEGNDFYGGNIVGLGFGWDIGVGAVCDFGGDDKFAVESSTQAVAQQASIAILYNVGGNDVYAGTTQGQSPEKVTYHSQPECGGNFGFFIDYFGEDLYGGKTDLNNSCLKRGGTGGFFIDKTNSEDALIIKGS